jgi:hypothetical protein
VVHHVVSCTKRKRAEPVEWLSAVPPGAPAERAWRWLERLEGSEASPVPAAELYVGEHGGLCSGSHPTVTIGRRRATEA